MVFNSKISKMLYIAKLFIFVKFLKKLNFFAAFAFPPKVFLHNSRETVDIWQSIRKGSI
jgi:hypothetical protein